MIPKLLSRIDETLLYPPFLLALNHLLLEAYNSGLNYWVVSGFRPYNEQTRLYNQGRSMPGKVVTNARAGESSHNFGLAVDVVKDGIIERAGLQPDYKPESYEPLRLLAPKHGLVWGGDWKIKDYSHLQLPNYVTAQQLEPLKFCYELSGLPSVFEYLSKGAQNDVPNR